MHRLFALTLGAAALLLAACTPADADPATHPALRSASVADSLMLFTFEADDAPPWMIENDGVMGGRSQGFVEITEGLLVFTGEVVTRGGGFTSTRAWLRLNLSDYDGIELRVRGSGRTFELDVDQGTRNRGREVNRRGPIPTSDTWETVRVPFASLRASAHGNPVRVDPLDPSALQSLGIYITDGIDGPFRLEIDWIRAYRTAE